MGRANGSRCRAQTMLGLSPIWIRPVRTVISIRCRSTGLAAEPIVYAGGYAGNRLPNVGFPGLVVYGCGAVPLGCAGIWRKECMNHE